MVTLKKRIERLENQTESKRRFLLCIGRDPTPEELESLAEGAVIAYLPDNGRDPNIHDQSERNGK